MCGIAGCVNFSGADGELASVLGAMNDAQIHRGPDGGGVWCDGSAGLGHRRLAVIDLAGGAQPKFNEDRTIAVVFNGEIYNFRELRERLIQRGHRLTGAGDTEILAHLYEEYGTGFAAMLSGMFAVAIRDGRRRKLILARDRFGKKPLLYFRRGTELVFASEFSALKVHPDFPWELNLPGIADYLSLQYIPGPETAFAGVRKLPPATVAEFDEASGRLQLTRYWQLAYAPKLPISEAAAAAELRELTTAAVRKRLMSEVPNGAFLSGGVDSTIVAGLMAQLRDEPTDVFTIGFDDPAYDERADARRAAARINRLCGGRLRLHEKVDSPDDFGLLENLVTHFGEPFADASMLPTALLCRFAREKLTVCLGGDGADEIFAGYDRYRFMRLAAAFDAAPEALRRLGFGILAHALPAGHGERSRSGRLRRALLAAASPAADRYFRVLDRCVPELKNRLWTGETPATWQALRPGAGATATGPEQWCEVDISGYLPNDILVKADIAAMASSLEVRTPFLDTELTEFAARLPFEYKLRGSIRKSILRRAFPELLPPEEAAAPKRGFGVPVARWLRGGWKNPARERLFGGALANTGLIRMPALEKIWREHESARADHAYLLFNLLVLEMFLSGIRQSGKF